MRSWTAPDGGRGVAVVTGGSRGIGAAVVERLAHDGHTVLFTHSASTHDAAGLAARLTGVHAMQQDITLPGAAERIVDAAQELGPITVLVNNAAVTGRLGPLVELEDRDLTRVLETNLAAPVLLCREVLRRHLTEALSIVNVSSLAASTGSPDEYVVYAATKAALETLTVGLARETAARGVRVNAVAPGLIDTTIHARAGEPGRAFRLGSRVPLGRPGTAHEIAAAVAWLVSEEAGYVTGEVLHVTGGAR